jgi:CHAT domain-containing protein
VLGEKHPHSAQSLNNLALLYKEMGDYKAALLLYRKAQAITREALGEKHPSYVSTLNNLAWLSLLRGRPGAAALQQEQALYLTRRQLALDASVQSERQQRASADALRYRLNARLSMPDEAAHFSHNHVLSWKGSAFAAQQARRRFLLAQSNPNTRVLALQLRDVTRSLALLAQRQDRASLKRAEELALRKQDLEVALALLSDDFRLAVRPPSSEEFREGLPPGTVLLDFLVHTGYDPARPLKGQAVQRRLLVWVVQPGLATVRLNLGPMGPIEKDIEAWRLAIEKGSDGGTVPARLREKVWAPLEKHLVGAKAVLLSPDQAIGRLPFAALPGREKGKVLLEEWPLAVMPVPRVLPLLLERPNSKPSLLALGGVDYGDGPGTWASLPATVSEVTLVAQRYRAMFKVVPNSLSGGKATKAALAKALPNHRFAHLATHGFFAPPDMKSYLDRDMNERELFGREGLSGWEPGLLSGLVLAGANKPTADDDGILTASEVAELDLSGVELAVLSACQTGLGKEAAGEGILGLQRAFAVSGCKTAVTSLWSVHDAATAVLMERFYLHLWQKKLSKLEALRQAQLDVMRHPEWVEERAKKLTGVRGLRGVGKASEIVVAGKKQRRSPVAWWAAWQLSGDWR